MWTWSSDGDGEASRFGSRGKYAKDKHLKPGASCVRPRVPSYHADRECMKKEMNRWGGGEETRNSITYRSPEASRVRPGIFDCVEGLVRREAGGRDKVWSVVRCARGCVIVEMVLSTRGGPHKVTGAEVARNRDEKVGRRGYSGSVRDEQSWVQSARDEDGGSSVSVTVCASFCYDCPVPLDVV